METILQFNSDSKNYYLVIKNKLGETTIKITAADAYDLEYNMGLTPVEIQ